MIVKKQRIWQKLKRATTPQFQAKDLIPTEDRMKLITVFPDVVKSPELTADWENVLALVAKSKLAMEKFMTDIENMVLEIVYRADLQEAIHEPFYRIVLTMERGSDVQWLYREKFYAHGLYRLLDEGAEQGFSETSDEMAQMTIHIASTPYKNI